MVKVTLAALPIGNGPSILKKYPKSSICTKGISYTPVTALYASNTEPSLGIGTPAL